MSATIKVLLIEDDPDDARFMAEALRRAPGHPWRVALRAVPTLAGGRAALAGGGIDVVLLDLHLPDSEGLSTLTRLRADDPSVPIVILTGTDSLEVAHASLRRGAQDYLVKGSVDPDGLARAIRHALERSRLLARLRRADKLRAELRERRRADEAKERFLQALSHELRSPLAVIKTTVAYLRLKMQGRLGDEEGRMLDRAGASAERLLKLVHTQLQLARLGGSRVLLQPRPVDLASLVHRCVEGYRMLARESPVTLAEDASPVLPRVWGESDLLEQVVVNLLDNALRYARGRVTVTMRAGTPLPGPNEHARELTLTVADDGPGMPPEQLPGLFERFSRSAAPGGRGPYKGTGLGLHLCREIVTRHRGRIWVESVLGQGTEVHVALPAEPREAPLRTA